MLQRYVEVVGALFIATFSFSWWIKNNRLPLPPSIKIIPNNVEPWRFYADLSKRLGSMLCVSLLGRPIIVINSAEVAFQLLEKVEFSCKPKWPMAELLGRQKNVGFQYYGERLKKSRKVLNGSLNANSVHSKWLEILDVQSKSVLHDLLCSPEAFYTNVHKAVQELVFAFAYGGKPDVQYISLAKKVMTETGVALQPGRWMVNFFPALAWIPAWFPGANFQRWAREAKDTFYKITREQFYRVKNDWQNGEAQESFVLHSLGRLPSEHLEEDEDIIMCAAGSLFSAGTETLIGTILTFLAVVSRHKEVQDRAFHEISTVIGTSRLPDIRDIKLLSYVDCVIQEVHRINPAIPLVTHSNTIEDSHGGYRIPKKSWIMANVWSMLHDERMYPDPEKFYPERFLLHSESNRPRPDDPRTLVFGFGRRRCPGTHFSNVFLFLVISRIIALFELTPDEDKGPIEYSIGLVPMPKEFSCRFKPRMHAADVIAACKLS